jgi:hypothetical protein
VVEELKSRVRMIQTTSQAARLGKIPGLKINNWK